MCIRDRFGDLVVAGVTTAEALNVTGIATVGTALSFADNIKAQFGTGGDLIIYHSSDNHTRITESGTGNLLIQGAHIHLTSAAGDETFATFNDDGASQLYFCLLYTSPSPRDRTRSRMPSSA